MNFRELLARVLVLAGVGVWIGLEYSAAAGVFPAELFQIGGIGRLVFATCHV